MDIFLASQPIIMVLVLMVEKIGQPNVDWFTRISIFSPLKGKCPEILPHLIVFDKLTHMGL